jgi:hypothetical protein
MVGGDTETLNKLPIFLAHRCVRLKSEAGHALSPHPKDAG